MNAGLCPVWVPLGTLCGKGDGGMEFGGALLRKKMYGNVPKNRATLLGVLVKICWSLYWGPPILGKLPYVPETYPEGGEAAPQPCSKWGVPLLWETTKSAHDEPAS